MLMQTPRDVDISITARCNSSCIYCAHLSSPSDVANDIPLEQWQSFFQELGESAVMNVTVSGGEPFFSADIKEILASIVKNRMRFSILSNGSLITPEMASYIKGLGRCDYIQISLDGPDASIHDYCRGEGSFDGAIAGIKNLKLNNVPVAVRVTVNKHNVHYLEATAALLLEELGLPGFSTNSASNMGLCKDDKSGTQLGVTERELAMETLVKLNKKYNNRISAQAGPLADAGMWNLMLNRGPLTPGQTYRGVKGGYLSACGCVFSKIAVRADGVYVPCSQLSHIELGRINRDDLATIWQKSEYLNKLRARKDIPLSRFEGCRDCDYKSMCTGNCPALAYNYHGDVFAPSPDSCLKLFQEKGGKVPDYC